MQTVSSQRNRAQLQRNDGPEPEHDADTIRLTVNGRIHDVEAAPDTALLYVLRNDLELNGPKYGCGLGECGTCTVLIDGVAARSCVIPIEAARARHRDARRPRLARASRSGAGGLHRGAGRAMRLLPQRHDHDHQGAADAHPHPSETEVLEALRYNLCRCGAHIEIMRAAMRAAGHVAEAQD
jgi:nicotinate dehydrogenase subunit A